MQIPLALLAIPWRRVEKTVGLTILVGAALALALSRKGFAAEADSGAADSVAATAGSPAHAYSLSAVHRVNGRQGVCVEGGFYWVSGSTIASRPVPEQPAGRH